MKSLITLISEFAALDQQLIESGGELSPDIEAELTSNAEGFRAKVDRYKLYLEHLKSQEEYFKAIEDQAAAAKKLFKNHQEKLKENLKLAMRILETEDLEGDDFRFKLCPMKSKVSINEAELDPKYLKEQTIKVPDKEAIGLDLELGIDVKGATLEPVSALRSYVNVRPKTVKAIKGGE